jgi:hypothetical protein
MKIEIGGKKSIAQQKAGKCDCCGKEAMFFHSRCCGAHFEGVITKDGIKQIVCERCGKFVAELK